MFATAAGVQDIEGFRACVEDSTYLERVREDARAARSLGLRGTPTVIIDGVELTCATLSRLEDWVSLTVNAATERSP